MDDRSTKSVKSTPYLDTRDSDLRKPSLPTIRPKIAPVLSTFLKKTPTKNNELEIEEKDFEKKDFEELLAELYLDEVVTIKKDDGKHSSSDDKFSDNKRTFYDFLEICDGCDPEEIKELSPWNKNGPILKKLPSFNEMEACIKKKICVCLLLHCQNDVLTKHLDIDSLKITPWNFLCRNHKEEVAEKYGYNPRKKI
jgi:hypothetical protein